MVESGDYDGAVGFFGRAKLPLCPSFWRRSNAALPLTTVPPRPRNEQKIEDEERGRAGVQPLVFMR